MYFLSQSKWVWATTGETISLSKWAAGEPRNPNSESRLTILHENRFQSFWVSKASTIPQRHICEVIINQSQHFLHLEILKPNNLPNFNLFLHLKINFTISLLNFQETLSDSEPPTPPTTTTTTRPTTTTTTLPQSVVPCRITNDLEIILDSSSSMNLTDYIITLHNFLAELSAAFSVHPSSRLAFKIYSNGVQSIIPLTNSLTAAQIQTAIKTTPYHGGTTSPTDKAVDAAVAELEQNNRGVPRTMIVLTVGSSDNPQLTLNATSRAKSLGIRMFAVGIGSSNVGQNYNELLALAGDDIANLYNVPNWNDLQKLLIEISTALCPNSSS
jgi:hypothetical protein